MIYFRIRINSELYELLNNIDIVQRINFQRLCWLGHVVRMEEDASERRIFDVGICGIRWKNQIEEALSSISVPNWRSSVRSRGAWKDVLRHVEIRQLGCYDQLS